MNRIFLVSIVIGVFIATVIAGGVFIFKGRHDRNSKSLSYQVTQPILWGVSEDHKLYKVVAQTLKQVSKNQYQLVDIHTEYYLNSDKSRYITLAAKQGTFHYLTKVLELANDVEINFSDGYRVTTNSLNFDFNHSLIFTPEAITVSGIKGKILAERGLEHNLKTQQIHFLGPVHTTLLDSPSPIIKSMK